MCVLEPTAKPQHTEANVLCSVQNAKGDTYKNNMNFNNVINVFVPFKYHLNVNTIVNIKATTNFSYLFDCTAALLFKTYLLAIISLTAQLRT
jgi:hypothetical protein